jgi:hypothetical protein
VYFLKCLLFRYALSSAKIALRNENDFVKVSCPFSSTQKCGCRSPAHESQSPALWGAYKFNVCYGFSKIADPPSPPSWFPKETQLLHRKHHGLHVCIPDLKLKLLANTAMIKFDRTASYIDILSSYRYQVLTSLITRCSRLLTTATFHTQTDPGSNYVI